ncbi:MAG: glycosyltransferase family 4 protein [Deinococcota bacterium]
MSTVPNKTPLRLTFFLYTLETVGGAERATTLVANGLAERGHEVSIVTTWGQSSRFPLHPGIRLHALKATAGSFKRDYVRDVRKLRIYLREHQPDLLIGSEVSSMLLALPAAAGLATCCVGWEHFNFNTIFNRPRGHLNRWRLARRLAARFARAVVVLTRRDAELWRAGLPDLRAHLEVIPNPLPFPQVPVNPYVPDRKVVLAVGRLTEQKGFDLLLEAWAQIEADFPDWTLRIVGDGEEAAPLQAQALHAGLDQVEFVGKVQDMPAQYAAAGVYCLSSRYEGLSLVLLESLAFGLPVVAFDCQTGPREVIEHDVNGLLVPPGNTAALAEALRQLMLDPARRMRLSERSHALAGRFSAEDIITKWEDLLGQLRRGAARPELALVPRANS